MPSNKNDFVTVSSFTKEIQKLLEDYGDEVESIVEEEVVEVSKDTVKKLRKDSPKDTGKYSKGWRLKKKKGRLGIETIIYNATHYWLVHVLENGYYSRKRKERVNGQEHVKPAEKWAESELLKRLKEKL